MAIDLSDALGRAIEAGDFDAAQPLVLEYAETVRTRLSLASSAKERESVLRAALQTLNQHRYLACAMRSHISARLQASTGQARYQATTHEAYTWQFEA